MAAGGLNRALTVKLKADLVLRHSLAGQARPVDCMLSFFDMLCDRDLRRTHVTAQVTFDAIEYLVFQQRFIDNVLLDIMEKKMWNYAGGAHLLAKRTRYARPFLTVNVCPTGLLKHLAVFLE